jgi:MFS transporter, Spinster family, sphingosine-1-phosphate transporter
MKAGAVGKIEPETTLAVSPLALYTVAVLFAVNLVGYLDRQIITLLVQPIKATLHLSDGQIGLMQGTAFVLTFSVAGLFMGRLVDRRNRRNLLIACILIWSVSAAASGLAQNSWQLFLARMGVGVGEAALLPTAISLISDLFNANRRGKALGFFMTGVYAGVGLSLILVAFALPSLNKLTAELIGRGWMFETWRLVMLTMLVPGIVCCVLLALVREPVRTFTTSAHTPLDWSGVRDWSARIRLFIPHHIGFALATFGAYAMFGWLPTILIREHGLIARDAGLTYGVLVAVIGSISAFLGGVLGDWRSRKAGSRGRIGVALYGMPVAFAGFLLMAVVPTVPGLLLGTGLITAGLGLSIVIGFLSVSDLSPPESRGQISSIYLIFTGLIGSGGGPAVVGYANDIFGGPTHSLSSLLGMIGAIVCIASILLVRFSIGRVPESVRPAPLVQPGVYAKDSTLTE